MKKKKKNFSFFTFVSLLWCPLRSSPREIGRVLGVVITTKTTTASTKIYQSFLQGDSSAASCQISQGGWAIVAMLGKVSRATGGLTRHFYRLAATYQLDRKKTTLV